MFEPAVALPTADMVKRKATLTAQFALRGFEVQEVAYEFMVTRRNLSKHCPTLSAFAILSRLEGVKS